MSEVKNIVVIGASIAGHTVVNELLKSLPTSHRILIIDASDFTYWPIAGLRAAVQPGWEERVVIPIKSSNFFPAGSRHEVIAPNKVIELRKNSVVLENPFEGSTEVPFEKCVIATGALQPTPMRAALGSTLVEIKADLRKMQEDVAKASKVLIIGGGPSGLEYAGEIKDRFPDKSVTVVHSNSRVLNPSSNPNPGDKAELWTSPSSYPKLSTALEAELQAMKVDLILNDRVDFKGKTGPQEGMQTFQLQSGKTVQADYVFVSVGNKPASGLVEQADKGAVAGGMVKVDQYLRVTSSNPSSILAGGYYAIGDVCNTPGWKTGQTAQADGVYAASSILADIKGTKAKPFARGTMHGLVVPLGKSRGAGSITVPLLGTIMAPKFVVNMKGKDLFIPQSFVPLFKGYEKVASPPVKA